MFKRVMLFISLFTAISFASTTSVSVVIHIDSPTFTVDKGVNSSTYAFPFGAVDDTSINRTVWDNTFNEIKRMRENLGNGVWDTVTDAPSKIITELCQPISGKYARIFLETDRAVRCSTGTPGQKGRYSHSFNWKTAVGPMDPDDRLTAWLDCGLDTSGFEMPPRLCIYGIPEALEVCDSLGAMPNFVLGRVYDTTYCINDSFDVDTACINWVTGDTDSVVTFPVYRKSLKQDAIDFAEYLFGDDSSGWSGLRIKDGIANPVDTDRMSLGNDTYIDTRLWFCMDDSIVEEEKTWPRYEITRALFPDAVQYPDTVLEGSETWQAYPGGQYRNRYTLRLAARLDTIAAAIKSVKPDIKIGGWVVGPYLKSLAAHRELASAALAAENIDFLSFHRYWAGGHMDTNRLNYTDINTPFMCDTLGDNVVHSNHFLLNETLGDLAMMNYIPHYCNSACPIYIEYAEELFGGTYSNKPLEISEYNRAGHYYKFGGEFNQLITVANAIKFLEFMRAFNAYANDPRYNLEATHSHHSAMGHSAYPIVWGYDTLSANMDSLPDDETIFIDGGDGWRKSCEYGYHAPWLAHKLYNNIGYAGLEYELTQDSVAMAPIVFPYVSEIFPEDTYKVIPDSIYAPDSLFTTITVDPYIDEDGSIISIIVNRDTVWDCSTTVICSLTPFSPCTMQSLDVVRLGINDSIWKEACYYVYEDSTFLAPGYAHNGFRYYSDSLGVYLRFKPVYIDSCDQTHEIDTTIETDSTNYFAITLDPMSFAWVKVVPHIDSVEIILAEGWNLISIPMYTGDSLLKDIFNEYCPAYCSLGSSNPFSFTAGPDSMPSIVRWTGSGQYGPYYYPFEIDYRDSANIPGESYWVFSNSSNACSVTVIGRRCNKFILEISNNFSADISSFDDKLVKIPNSDYIKTIGSVWNDRLFTYNTEPCCYFNDSTHVWEYDKTIDNFRLSSCIESNQGYIADIDEVGETEDNYIYFPKDDYSCSQTYSVTRKYKDLYRILLTPPSFSDISKLFVDPTYMSLGQITVKDQITEDNIANCLVWIETSDTIVIGYTNSSGGYRNTLIDINDSTYIFLYKPGYRKLLVYPYGSMEDDTFQSDIVIYGDITIGSGDTLTVLPGTNVYAAYRSDATNSGTSSDRTEIFNNGYIEAVGDSLYPILFTVDCPPDSEKEANDWKGIVHSSGGTGEYEHCRFEYMRYFQGYNGAGDVEFENCEFAHSLYYTITYGANGGSTHPLVEIEDCDIDTAGSTSAIILYGSANSSYVKHCIFDSSAHYAFEVKDSGYLSIEACTLNSCYGAVLVRDFASVEIYDSDLLTNKSWTGWNTYDCGTLYVENSTLTKNSSGYGPKTYNSGVSTYRYCHISGFTNYGVYYDNFGSGDLGTNGDLGHNCIWSSNGSAYRIYTSGDSIPAYGNWIDTLIVSDHVGVAESFPVDSCDTAMAKIIAFPEKKEDKLPRQYSLGNAIPNPFNNSVAFEYSLPCESDVKIEIFNIIGKNIIVLFDGKQQAGVYRATWDGIDNSGHGCSSGTYLYRLKTDDYEETKKMTLIK